MKNFLAGFCLFSFLVLISSCGKPLCSVNKKGFITSFNSMIETVEKEDLQGDDKKWDLYDKKLEVYVNDCYKQYESEMSNTEKQEFWAGSVRYYWERHGLGIVRRLGDKDDPLASEISTNVKEVWGSVDAVMNELIDEFGDSMKDFDTKEFENLMNDMGSDVEKWGKKLEKIFENLDKK